LRFCKALRFRRLCLDMFPTLIFQKLTKSLGRKFRVPDGVLDIAVPEIMLDGASILAVVGELKPTGMPHHMRVHRKGEGGEHPGAGEYSPDRRGAQGPALLRDKHLGCPRVVPLQTPERPQLGAPQGVGLVRTQKFSGKG
jgi:hypothetical protein